MAHPGRRATDYSQLFDARYLAEFRGWRKPARPQRMAPEPRGGRPPVDLMTQTTLDDLARRQVAERGAKVALRDGSGQVLTYAELEQRACRVANALIAAGIRRGQRVAWLGKNTLAYFEYLLGAAKAGAVMVPMNWRFAAPEIEYLVQDSKAPLIVAEPEFAAKLESSTAGRRILFAGGADDSYAAWRDAAPAADTGLRGSDADAVLQLYTS